MKHLSFFKWEILFWVIYSGVFQFHCYRQRVLEEHVKTYLKVSQTACSALEKTW